MFFCRFHNDYYTTRIEKIFHYVRLSPLFFPQLMREIQKRFSVSFEFYFSDTADTQHLFFSIWELFGKGVEGFISEDDVGGDAVFFGDGGTEGFEVFEVFWGVEIGVFGFNGYF